MKLAHADTGPALGEVLPFTRNGHEPPPGSDPRGDLDDSALRDASRLANPAVAARASRKDGLGLAAGAAAALLLGGVTFWSLSSGREMERAPASAPARADVSVQAPPVQAPVDLQAGAADTAPAPGGSLVFTSSPQPLQLQGRQADAAASNGPSILAQRFRSPSLIVDESGPVMAAGPAGAADAPAIASAPAVAAGGGDEFAQRADASASDAASATRMADPAFTVSQGTLIPAVLETAINTDLPGYVRAVVSEDVRSFDGSRVLIPRSSRLIGQYRSGLVAGQKRAYVLWSRLIRPDGASVAIASPATDEAGRTGLAGEVDSHFFKRFGSALLLSVFGAASAAATGGASVVLSGGANPAAVATQQNGGIAPTVRVRQGHPIRVFTARDLNFAAVGEPAAR